VIVLDGGEYLLAAGARAEACSLLDELRPAQLRELDTRAAQHYAARLSEPDPRQRAAIERSYMRHVERLCEALMVQQPTALADAVASMSLDQIAEPAHQHLLAFYRGLGEALCDRFAPAQRIFDTLLAEPELADAIRARALNSSANFALHQGSYEQALTRYRASLALWQQLGNTVRQGVVLSNMGIVHYELQEYPAAETHF
jgi:tetratricopeptide (TPR) repeat protein